MDGQTKLHRFRYHMARGFVEPDDVVADYGCGQAYGTALLSKVAKKVFAYDMEEGTIKYLQENKPKDNVEYNCVNLEELEVPRVDVVAMFEVLEHLYNPEKFVRKMKAKTKKFICLSVPIGEKLIFVEKTNTWEAEHDSTHHFSFPTDSHLIDLFVDDNWDLFYGFRNGVYLIAIFINKNSV